jgi:hypothetical protein
MGHVASIREMKNEYMVSVGKPEERDHLEELIVDERIILKCMLK